MITPPRPRDSLLPSDYWPHADAWARIVDAPPPDVHRVIRDVRAWVRRSAAHGVWPTVIARCGHLLCASAPEVALRTEVARVLSAGLDVPRPPWRERADPWTVVADAVHRHLTPWSVGEVADRDTGCSHLAHAAARALILHAQISESIGRDDRP